MDYNTQIPANTNGNVFPVHGLMCIGDDCVEKVWLLATPTNNITNITLLLRIGTAFKAVKFAEIPSSAGIVRVIRKNQVEPEFLISSVHTWHVKENHCRLVGSTLATFTKHSAFPNPILCISNSAYVCDIDNPNERYVYKMQRRISNCILIDGKIISFVCSNSFVSIYVYEIVNNQLNYWIKRMRIDKNYSLIASSLDLNNVRFAIETEREIIVFSLCGMVERFAITSHEITGDVKHVRLENGRKVIYFAGGNPFTDILWDKPHYKYIVDTSQGVIYKRKPSRELYSTYDSYEMREYERCCFHAENDICIVPIDNEWWVLV